MTSRSRRMLFSRGVHLFAALQTEGAGNAGRPRPADSSVGANHLRPDERIRAGATRMDRPADCLYSSTRRLILFLKPSSCVQYATTGNPTKQSTAMSILRPRQICHPDLSLAGVLKVVRGRYGTHLTSQSVQRKPGARADRQPASDTVNPCLLELPVGRHHLSRRRAVE